MTAIESFNLTKRFRSNLALNKVNIKVKDKAFHLLLGPNGSGKSKFIKLACGLLKPSEGRISTLGLEPVKNWSKLYKELVSCWIYILLQNGLAVIIFLNMFLLRKV